MSVLSQMKLPDVNVLVYSLNADSPWQATARHWLAQAFESGRGVGFAWLALVGFVRITTHARIMSSPLPVAQAVGVVDEWLAHPSARIVHPTERHADILSKLLLMVGTAGNLTNDAHLAALAIEHGATVGTFDRDFQRFSGVRFDLLH